LAALHPVKDKNTCRDLVKMTTTLLVLYDTGNFLTGWQNYHLPNKKFVPWS